jgi:hypothetical protein
MRAVGWFFVPEGHLTVARRFIAGSVRNGPAFRRDARIPPLMRPNRGSAFPKLVALATEIRDSSA